MINGTSLLCIIDNHSKFPKVKKVNSLSADDLLQMAKLTFAEYRLPKKIVPCLGTNFMAETLKTFCRRINIQQAITLSYHHQNSGRVEACIKFVKCTITKYCDTKRDIHLILLQICSTPIGAGLPSPEMMLFNRLIRGLFPKMNIDAITMNNGDMQYEAIEVQQRKYDTGKDTQKDPSIFFTGATVAAK